jgi:hypothetical protein
MCSNKVNEARINCTGEHDKKNHLQLSWDLRNRVGVRRSNDFPKLIKLLEIIPENP